MIYVFWFLIGFILLCNLIIALYYPISAMREDFWENQSIIGKILATIFYIPAWILKFCYILWKKAHSKIKHFIFPFK